MFKYNDVRCIDVMHCFFVIFLKGDDFCDILFAFPDNKAITSGENVCLG